MLKRTLINLLLCLSIVTIHADDLSTQLQQLNSASVADESILWQRMRDGFMLNHKETKEVKYWEKRYGNPRYFNIIMQNAAPYLYFVITEMQRRGVPTELALIPIVESTYNPNAVSPAAISTGMWQFVASSGKRFGMIQNADLDERKDIVKSTRAAINYLIYLHDMFGSWELAIAAYNWGEGNINNAVKNADSYNFYDLDVRDVTKQYVPKVIALANIIQNPSRFGIKLTDLKNQPYFAIINPRTTITVNKFMNMADLSPAINKKLNPQYNSTSYSVSPNQRLLLPVSDQPAYLASLGGTHNNNFAPPVVATPIINASSTNTNISSNPLASRIHIDTNRDTPTADGITTLAAAGDAETQTPPTAVTAPTPVAVNNATVSDLLGEENHRKSATNTFYTVATGDTLYSIAKKFNVPITKIIADNQLIDNTLKLNQRLIVHN